MYILFRNIYDDDYDCFLTHTTNPTAKMFYIYNGYNFLRVHKWKS